MQKTFFIAAAIALFAAMPAMAQQSTTVTQTTVQTTKTIAAPTPAPAPAPAPVAVQTRSAAQADAINASAEAPYRTERSDAKYVGTFNDDEKNDRSYTLIWPDWESPYETPANFNN